MEKVIFSDFIYAELNKRNWSQADLAKAAKIKPGSLSNILTNTRRPGTSICKAIALAFHIPVEEVYIAAGFLPTKKPRTVREERMIYRINQMSDEDQEDLEDYIDYRLEKNRGRNEKI